MSKSQPSITVFQCMNPRFDDSRPVSPANSEELYRVEKTVNTISCKIGEYLTGAQIESLIDNDNTVTVVGPK